MRSRCETWNVGPLAPYAMRANRHPHIRSIPLNCPPAFLTQAFASSLFHGETARFTCQLNMTCKHVPQCRATSFTISLQYSTSWPASPISRWPLGNSLKGFLNEARKCVASRLMYDYGYYLLVLFGKSCFHKSYQVCMHMLRDTYTPQNHWAGLPS